MDLMHQVRKLYWHVFRPLTLGSRCIVIANGQVLLVRHTYQQWYYLPGGGVQRGESFADAARREVREETGLVVERLRLLHLYYSQTEGKHDHVALFLTEHIAGELRQQADEIAELGFYPIDALPDLTSPATRRRISEYQTLDYSTAW